MHVSSYPRSSISPIQSSRWYGTLLWPTSSNSPSLQGQWQGLAQCTEHYNHLSHKKLDHKWLGPYAINKVVWHNAYGFQLPASFGHTHPVFSVVLLWPYHQDPIPEWQTPPPPPPVIHDGIQEYEVEKILDSQSFRGRLEYLVHWKGYGAADDLWIPEKDVSSARRLVTEFYKQNPEASWCISATIHTSLPFQPFTNFTEPTKRTLFDWTIGRAVTHTAEPWTPMESAFTA